MTKDKKKKNIEQVALHIIDCLIKLNKEERERVFWTIDSYFCIICGSMCGGGCTCSEEDN